MMRIEGETDTREAWHAAVHGAERVRKDSAMEQQQDAERVEGKESWLETQSGTEREGCCRPHRCLP